LIFQDRRYSCPDNAYRVLYRKGQTVEKVHDFIAENDRKLSGKHHEIYLSDIRRIVPERLNTIVRQTIT